MSIKNTLTEGNDLVELRSRIRHSAAHVMAEAVLSLFPDAQFAVGPSTSEGFYYDFEVGRSFTPEDLQQIEDLMRETIKKDLTFEYSEITRSEAIACFSEQKFKLEIIDSISEEQTISIYTHGDFVDLCRGPHVESSSDIVALKLMSVAGAYWRGDENNLSLIHI